MIIFIENKQDHKINVQVSNMNGDVVAQYGVLPFSSTKVNSTTLAKGIYVVSLTDEIKSKQFNLVK
jgi:Secretion system C-terminal sorting domain